MKTSVERVGYALMNEDGSYENIKWFISEEAGGRDFSAEPKGELTEVYADGKLVRAVEINDGYDIKLTLIDLIDDVNSDWLGYDVNSKGIAEYATNKERNRFALVVVDANDDGTYEMTTYFKCQVSKRPTIASKTSEGKYDPMFTDFEISARPRDADKLVRITGELTSVSTLPEEISEPVSEET